MWWTLWWSLFRQAHRRLFSQGQVADVTARPLWQHFIATSWTLLESISYGINNRFTTTSESISQIPDIHAIQLLIPSHHFTHQRHAYTTKTTSTGFLSRSSCSPHHHQVHSITLTQHHHVPVGAWPPRNLGLCRCPSFEVSVFHHTRLGMRVKMKRTIPCACVEGRNGLIPNWYPSFVYHTYPRAVTRRPQNMVTNKPIRLPVLHSPRSWGWGASGPRDTCYHCIRQGEADNREDVFEVE